MKTWYALLLMALHVPAFADGDERNQVYYGQLGLERDYFTLKNGTLKSIYEGWGAHGEAGLDWGWSNQTGLNLALLGRMSNLENTGNSDTALETAKTTVIGAKAGLFFGPFTLGGGVRTTELKSRSIQSGNEPVVTDVKGLENFAYLSMTFFLRKNKYRVTLEAEIAQGKLGAVKSQAGTIALRFGIFDSIR